MGCNYLSLSLIPAFDTIDPSHKSQNASVPYPTMQHFVTEMCTGVHISVTKWCIVGYLSGALWDLWDGSINTDYEHFFCVVTPLLDWELLYTIVDLLSVDWSNCYIIYDDVMARHYRLVMGESTGHSGSTYKGLVMRYFNVFVVAGLNKLSNIQLSVFSATMTPV